MALVIAIGLVVDDAIVMLENIYRRVETGETPLVASYRGASQVSFAIISTTVVLIAVFVPLIFIQGIVGKLFTELALTLSFSIIVSAFVTDSSMSPSSGVTGKPNVFLTRSKLVQSPDGFVHLIEMVL